MTGDTDRASIRLAELVAALSPLDGRVLDVGCGPGARTAELARRAGSFRSCECLA